MKLRYLLHCFALLTFISCDLNGMAASPDDVIAHEKAADQVLKIATDTVVYRAQQALNDSQDVKSVAEIDTVLNNANTEVEAALTGIPEDAQVIIRGIWIDEFYNPIKEIDDLVTKISSMQTNFTTLKTAIRSFHIICTALALNKKHKDNTVILIYNSEDNHEGGAHGNNAMAS